MFGSKGAAQINNNKSLARILNSNFILLLLIALACDLVLTVALPNLAQDWYLNAIATNDELFCAKAFNYLLNDNHPHVLLLGSSVVAAPSYACDQAEYAHHIWSTLPHMGLYSRYSDCKALTDRLTKSTGETVSVVNLGLAGTVASDYAAIMEKIALYKEAPKLIVCCISPQEFFWNDTRAVNNTHLRKAFQSYPWPAPNPVTLLYDRARRAWAWHLATVQAELGAEKQQLAWNFSNAIKGDKKSLSPAPLPVTPSNEAAGFASDDTHALAPPANKAKQGSEAAAVQNLNPDAGVGANSRKRHEKRHDQFEDLALYKKHYGNVDQQLFAKHAANFARALQLAKENGLNIVVVNMPLTTQNKNIIPAHAKDEYFCAVRNACTKTGVPYYDIDSCGKFVAMDFYDSAHLNERGAAKLFDRLSQMVSVHNGTYLTHAGALQ